MTFLKKSDIYALEFFFVCAHEKAKKVSKISATIKDIADRLGIAVSTVSKGLNGANDISEDLRQLVHWFYEQHVLQH